MKRNSTDSIELAGHSLHKGQRTKVAGKRVVITRVKQDTVWYRAETNKELAQHLWAKIKANRFFGKLGK